MIPQDNLLAPARENNGSLIGLGRGLALVVALVSLGCGRQPSDSDTVDPPERMTVESEEAVDPKVLGGLELPPGEIPTGPAVEEPASGGGIEMPRDLVLPDDAGDDAGAATSPKIEYGTWEEIQSLARSTGRVTIVDLWSLACEPCLKEFPGLVRLHESMGSKVQCIAVDLDFDGRKSRPPEYYETQVVEFLKSVDAEGFPMYISITPSDDVFAAAKLASIPAVFVFDADGQVAKVFVDAGESAGFTYEKDIVPLVTKLAGS